MELTLIIVIIFHVVLTEYYNNNNYKCKNVLRFPTAVNIRITF